MNLFEYVAWTQLVEKAKKCRARLMLVPVDQLLTVAEVVNASREGQKLAESERRFRRTFREESPT